MPISIVIVGAGFCGTMTAVRLLSVQSVTRLSITLVDDRRSVARGIAYRPDDEGWLLNAPARTLSARREHPDDFVDYCRRGHRPADPDDFLPRAWYGDYLAHLLQDAELKSKRHQLCQQDGRVVALQPCGEGRTMVCLQSGVHIPADHVVLATGHHTGRAYSAGVFDGRPLGPRFIRNPWDAMLIRDVPPDSHFFMWGSGLTALDLVHALDRRTERPRFTLMSRRGLLPQQHRRLTQVLAPEAKRALLDDMTGRPRRCFAAVRQTIAEHRARDGDWREVIDCLRPAIPQIWARWSDADRRAFVRHLAPYWDTHRHRQPPRTASLTEQLLANGRLTILRGRLRNIYRQPSDELQLIILPRASTNPHVIQPSYVVDCTGTGATTAYSPPESGVSQWPNRYPRDQVSLGDSLFDQLSRDGMATFDWNGLCVDESYSLIPADGFTGPSVSYVGPALRSRYWEATAVPELLMHIDRMIDDITRQFAVGQNNDVPSTCR